MKSRIRISRRQAIGGGLGIAALAAGGVYVAAGEPYDFFNAMLRSSLPGVKLSEKTVRAFTADVMQGRNPDFYVKFEGLLRTYRVIGYHGVTAALGDSWAFERFYRDMLSFFLVSTNFFDLADPTSGEVKYVGFPPACGNPFAQFDR
jgi:hypothetical protein